MGGCGSVGRITGGGSVAGGGGSVGVGVLSGVRLKGRIAIGVIVIGGGHPEPTAQPDHHEQDDRLPPSGAARARRSRRIRWASGRRWRTAVQHGKVVPGEGRTLLVAKAASDAMRPGEGGERLLTVAERGGAGADLV